MEIAEGCFRYIKRIFEQLDEFRAFEWVICCWSLLMHKQKVTKNIIYNLDCFVLDLIDLDTFWLKKPR